VTGREAVERIRELVRLARIEHVPATRVATDLAARGTAAPPDQRVDEVAGRAELVLGHRERSRAIDDEVEHGRYLLPIQPHRDAVGAGERTPIDVSGIVAGLVVAMVLELHRRTEPATETLADPAGQRTPGHAQREARDGGGDLRTHARPSAH
jgi:hypothetical protein